jgi:hypothetical protein
VVSVDGRVVVVVVVEVVTPRVGLGLAVVSGFSVVVVVGSVVGAAVVPGVAVVAEAVVEPLGTVVVCPEMLGVSARTVVPPRPRVVTTGRENADATKAPLTTERRDGSMTSSGLWDGSADMTVPPVERDGRVTRSSVWAR